MIKDIKISIIERLVRKKMFGGKHTRHILKGLPSHLKGEKVTKRVIKELIQDGWLIPAKKTGEIHYSLNPRKLNEIMTYYEKYCKK